MRYAFITVLLLFEIANPTSVHACTCFCKKHGVNDPKEMERESKAVFVGEVIAMHDATPEELRHGSDKFEWEMRVENVTGKESRRNKFSSAPTASQCTAAAT